MICYRIFIVMFLLKFNNAAIDIKAYDVEKEIIDETLNYMQRFIEENKNEDQ